MKGFVLDISGMKSVIFILQIRAVIDCVQSKRTYVECIQSVCLISHQVFLPIRCLYFYINLLPNVDFGSIYMWMVLYYFWHQWHSYCLKSNVFTAMTVYQFILWFFFFFPSDHITQSCFPPPLLSVISLSSSFFFSWLYSHGSNSTHNVFTNCNTHLQRISPLLWFLDSRKWYSWETPTCAKGHAHTPCNHQ